MGALNILTKAVGAAAIAAVGYDTVVNTKRRSIYNTRTEIGTNLTNAYMLNSTTGSGSPLIENVKDQCLSWNMDSNTRDAVVYTKNIVKEFFSNIIANAGTLVLGAGALLSKTNSSIPGLKGFIPKPLGIACAAGAALSLGAKLFANLFPQAKSTSLDVKL